MRFKNVNSIYVRGTIANMAVIGVGTALTHTRLIMPITVFIGAFAVVVGALWRWQERPYSGEIRKNLRDRSLGLTLFAVLGSLIFQGITIGGVVVATLSVNSHPCVCLNGDQMHSWFNLTLSGALFSVLEIAVVLNLAILLYPVVYRVRI